MLFIPSEVVDSYLLVRPRLIGHIASQFFTYTSLRDFGRVEYHEVGNSGS